ncbi:hypothetical protein [Flavobacterium seoulense]|uniref:Uncharacterized protein n=1 Tax=Flavobacterium seoulense TaxID=1492738 RepID=A0A066WR65_9FLAO|nr:hypothetical protein [Flavobacterium seoulense]KDN56542.1 hypothetical protein FEM21_00450 [Flavobacterium seoulense]
MKKKYTIINVFLALAVLFSILFQSIHAYEHHSEQIAAKYSQQHSKNKTDINNDHSVSEKCFSCDFSFSSFTTHDFYVFSFHKNNVVKTSVSLFFEKSTSFFTGSLFALRAPPIFLS